MVALGALAQRSARISGNLSPSQAFRLAATEPISVTIEIQGANVLAEHWAAIAFSVDPLAGAIVGLMGDFLANTAREIHRPNIDTGETFRSITAGQDRNQPAFVFRSGGGWAVDVGPDTPYAPFLEFGFIHHVTEQFIVNPFMIPAADAIAPLFEDAMVQLVELAVNRFFFTGPTSGLNSQLIGLRNSLYTFSRFLGDIQIFGVGTGPLAGRLRGGALRTARVLGDTDAAMRGAIGTRITRRFVGRFANFGLRSTLSASITGPSTASISSSNRVYNRIRGRAIGRAFGGTFGGIGF